MISFYIKGTKKSVAVAELSKSRSLVNDLKRVEVF